MATKDAVGAFLVHSVSVPGQRMKKGRVLSEADTEILLANGHDTILAASLEKDDIPEDIAATEIAVAAQGENVRLQAAFTGRANLFADVGGLVVCNRDRIDELNLIDEAITVATVDPYSIVERGQMLATVKIIPFAAHTADVQQACSVASNTHPLISVAPFVEKEAGVLLTRLPETKSSVLLKTLDVLDDRLTALGSRVKNSIECDHRAGEIASAIEKLQNDGCDPILIFGASAITDRRDEVPRGIEQAGGQIEHFGMPVDPGNLLLLASSNQGPVIGLPGCARSPKLNGFDWVLERICANVVISKQDIMRMGAGGLLKEISTRPQPRTGSLPNDTAKAPHAPRIAGILLAAGQSRRMGQENKLLIEIDGKAMVQHVVTAALASNLVSLSAVTGHQSVDVAAILERALVTSHHNPDFASGLSSSLRVGINHLPEDIDGVMVLLGDMPNITAGHIDRLIAAFNPLEGRAICVPTFQGKRGNPVLFAKDLLLEMNDIAGDVGAKHLIGRHEDVVAEVDMPDDAIFLDIDTPTALANYRQD
jgi:molybdenum cofactor cytidylyltransferase